MRSNGRVDRSNHYLSLIGFSDTKMIYNLCSPLSTWQRATHLAPMNTETKSMCGYYLTPGLGSKMPKQYQDEPSFPVQQWNTNSNFSEPPLQRRGETDGGGKTAGRRRGGNGWWPGSGTLPALITSQRAFPFIVGAADPINQQDPCVHTPTPLHPHTEVHLLWKTCKMFTHSIQHYMWVC